MKKIILFLTLLLATSGLFAQTQPTDTDGDGYYNISTLDHLRWISENDQSWWWSFELDNDIDASNTKNWNIGDHDSDTLTPEVPMGWIPIGTHMKPGGRFDGNGYVIKNLYINRPRSQNSGSFVQNVGFYGYVKGGEIKNLGIVDCNITGFQDTGALIGYSYLSGAGGMHIENCFSSGTVSGKGVCGGLVGNFYTYSLRKCYSTATVSGLYAGGLVGGFSGGLISDCYATGDVTTNTNESASFTGGLVGWTGGHISNSFATGSVNVNNGFIGSTSYAGGLIGLVSSSPRAVQKSFSTGIVSGNVVLGGFAGGDPYGLSIYWEKNYWDYESSNQQSSAGEAQGRVEGYNSDDMRTQSTYSNWDFQNTWSISPNRNDGYPFLKVFLLPCPELLSPESLSTRIDLLPRFSWSSITKADKYKIQVSESSSFGSTVIDEESSVAFFNTIDSLLENTIYYWRVKSINSSETSEWSEINSFTTIKLGPYLITPDNKKEDFATNGIFKWGSVAGATDYTIQVSESDDFTDLSINSTINTNEYTVGIGLAEGKTYYWRVKANTSSGETAWSEVWRFSTTKAPISIERLSDLNNEIDLPESGTAYLYYTLKEDGIDVDSDEELSIDVERDSETIKCNAKLITPGILRITIPADLISSSNTPIPFAPISGLLIDNISFEYDNDPDPYWVTKVPKQYQRTFDVFAEGSAGVGLSAGGKAGPISASLAKISVKGKAGMGMKFTVDQDDNLLIDRRVAFGASVGLAVPSIEAKAGKTKLEAKAIGADLSATKTLGQRLSVSDLESVDDGTKTMIQTGYFLEAVSLGGVAVSPATGICISAIVTTLNSLSGINQYFDDALISSYDGFGVEGRLDAGCSFEFGKLSMDVASTSLSGGLLFEDIDYNRPYPSSSNIYSEKKVKVVAKYSFSALEFGFEIIDDVELGSGNTSLFSDGQGGEVELGIAKNASGTVEKISLFAKGGSNSGITTAGGDTYWATLIDIPGEYSSAVGHSLGNFVSSDEFSLDNISSDIDNLFSDIKSEIGATPVVISTKEVQSQIIDFEVLVGIGAGITAEIGFKINYLDELEFTKKHTQLYADNRNYLITSNVFDESMKDDSFFDIIEELLEGTMPLIETAITNLFKTESEPITQNSDFDSEFSDKDDNSVGRISGNISTNGTLDATLFAADVPRTTTDAQGQQKVKMMYNSSSVSFRNAPGQKGLNSIVPDTVEFIAVSKCVDLDFIPEGDTVSVEKLDSPVELKMLIDTDLLIQYGFKVSDSSRVKMYKYIDSTLQWEMISEVHKKDTVVGNVTDMCTYALGIELNPADDSTPPSIKGFFPNDGDTLRSSKSIRAYLEDDFWGVGVNYGNSFMIINGDTVNYSMDLNTDSLFYEYGNDFFDTTGNYTVKIIASDNNGNIDSAQTSFYVDVMVHTISLNKGWNMVSSYIVTENDSIDVICQPVADNLLLGKNGSGAIYYPELGIDQITTWTLEEGYLFYMTSADTLQIEGSAVDIGHPIYLNKGWNMIAYLYAKTQDIDLAFAGISDHILLAKNGAGAIYYPELQINKIDALNPGEGYLVYMTAADTLECPVPPKTPPLKSKPTAGSIYTTKFANPSCNNATVILSSTMPDGTEITAYNTSGDILGSGLISNGVAAISIYGDDEFTDEIDGATSGENIRFKAQFANIEQDLELTDIKGVISNEEYSSITYHTNDLISAKVSNEVVSAAGLLGLYPNPTTNNAELSINLLQQSDLIIELYDNNGKRIKEVYQGQYINSLTIDTSDLPSGTYQVMVKTQNKTETIRLLIVK